MLLLLYGMSFGAMYYIARRANGPLVIPGDVYKAKGGRKVYFPFGGALVLTAILWFLIRWLQNFFGIESAV